jgi:pimeloyl-ACP methyl ester carboxylesterase
MRELPVPIHKYKDLELFFRQYGKGEPALLFIHGLGGNGDAWKYQISFFEKRHEIVTVDLFGHGRSSKDLDPVFAPRIDAEAIDRLMRDKVRKPYFVIGHSLAGIINAEIIRLGDPNLRGVVFADGTYQGFEEIINARIGFAEMMLALSDEALEIEVEKWYTGMIAAQPTDEERSFITSSLKHCSYRWLFESVAGCREYNRRHPPDQTPISDDLPIFVMEAEYGVGSNLRASWVNHFKSARYYFFDKAYHFFFITEHAKFNRLLEEFIGENYPEPERTG